LSELSVPRPTVASVPTYRQETLIELFRSRPALAAELLGGVLGVDVPAHERARADPADLPDLVPTEYRADAVVVLTQDGEPVMAVVLEVQLRRDGDKRWSWPVYVTTLRARLRCPVELLVVSPDTTIAAWCATPIRLGASGSEVRPLVLGPDLVPVVTDLEQAIHAPELAVLSAMAHGGHPGHRAVLKALLSALNTVEEQRAFLYLELVHVALPESARRHLEELMSTDTGEELSTLAQWYVGRGKAEGKAEGEANAVLVVLEARRIEVPDATRERIAGCRDLAQLEVWVRRAATAASVDDLFVDASDQPS
jgi:hypothetical protein